MRAIASAVAMERGVAHAGTRPDDVIPPPPTVTAETLGAGEDLYLEVVLNGSSTGRLQHFVRKGNDLCASASDLRSLGFALAPDRFEDACLSQLPGLTFEYDVQQQRVNVTAGANLLHLQRNVLNVPERKSLPATSGTGLVLNYDVYAQSGGGLGSVSALTELRAFSDNLGVLSSTALSRRYQVAHEGWKGDSVSLDTQWRQSWADSALALTLGDTFSGYTAWSRPTRIGGISLGTDFGLQPYRVTTPLPQFFGEATAPSAIELYVDGVRQYRGNVPAGPFQLNAVPGIDSGGQAQVVLTDALGRSSTVTFPVYAARQLLRQGLADWSVDLGAVREDYGIKSFSYGHSAVASGTLRYGVNDRLTLETHVENGAGEGTAGAGAVFNPWGAHIFNTSIATSRSGGQQYGLGYTWTGKRFNASFDSLRNYGNYRDVASAYGMPPARISERILFGMNVQHASFGANAVRLQYAGQAASRYAGLFVVNNIGHGASWNLSYNRNLDNPRDRSIFLGVTIALDARSTLSVSAQRDRDQTSMVVDASHPIDGDGGFGWHVQGRAGQPGGGLGEVGWLGNDGQLTVGVTTLGEGASAYADGNGALVLMDGHAFAARRIDDAFALVSTEGTPGIPVALENRTIGNTDSRGLLLVSRLNAYQDNRVSIDPLELPADSRVQRIESVIAPKDRAGVIVRFPVTRVRAASVLLVDDHRQPLPLGSRVDDGNTDAAVVGFDGLVYLDNLRGSTLLKVRLPDGKACSAQLTYPDQARDLPQLGPLACLPLASW